MLQSVEDAPRTLEYFTWLSSVLIVPVVILSLVIVAQRQVAYSRTLKGSKQKAGRQVVCRECFFVDDCIRDLIC
jgi:hypothetical protein